MGTLWDRAVGTIGPAGGHCRVWAACLGLELNYKTFLFRRGGVEQSWSCGALRGVVGHCRAGPVGAVGPGGLGMLWARVKLLINLHQKKINYIRCKV